MGVYVTRLFPVELELASLIAHERDSRSTRAGNAPAHGAPANGNSETEALNLVGVYGELAVARFLDLYPNLGVYHEEKELVAGMDLTHRVGVRSARKRFGLLVRPGDPDEGRFVAAFVRADVVALLGWMDAAEAKDERWVSAPGGRAPCYLVPERQLRDLGELRELVALERDASVIA